MTLRARLVLASAIIVAVVAVGALLLLQTQRSYLTDQVDDQLEAARPLVRLPPVTVGASADSPVVGDPPISALYIGYVGDGQLHTLLEGQLLDDVPDIETDPASIATLVNAEPFTVDGREGNTRFRVAFVQRSGSDPISVIALPLDEVDRAISRLRWALGGGTAVVIGVLLIAVWWVERLGLRPVARLTAAAGAIARGDRQQRVEPDARTEAGKLAMAFNVMLDELDATEKRLRQFVADASHELRTPLTSIRGYVELYREGGFRNEGQLDDMVRRLGQESSRMHDLVEDLLLLASLDEHRPLRRESVDLGQLLRDAATDAQVRQRDRHVAVHIHGEEPIELVGDYFRLQQVVSAIVNNALVYTDTSAAVRLVAAADNDRVEITIADTGPGLKPEDAARVFDRFFRGEQSRARRTGGSGLGLAIAKSIVEAHHGTIALHTAPGRGCRFVITLPHHPDNTAGDPRASSNFSAIQLR